MTRLLLAFALSATTALPALAAPTLRAEATVSGDTVTVGDLFDHAEGLEGIALFRAPNPGETGPLPAAAALAAAKRAGVPGCEAGEVKEVFVTRLSREISDVEITGSITARAATDYGVDIEDLDVTIDGDMSPVHFDAGEKGALAIQRFTADKATGRFEATLGLSGSRKAQPFRVTGSAVETVEVATVARPLERGDVIAKSDIRFDRKPKAQVPDAIAPSEAAGLAAKRSIKEGQPLRSGDLMRPQHVERGGFVTLIYASAGVSLSLKAKALAAGAAGDVISVQNLQSKRTVSGVVTGPSEVTVTAAATALARR